METNKFEKYIKSQLKEREIRPTRNAWENISSQLNTTSKNRKPFGLWIGLAASVMLLIGISLFYFSQSKVEATVSPVLVDTEKKPVSVEKLENAISYESKNTREDIADDKKNLKGIKAKDEIVTVVASKSRATDMSIANNVIIADEVDVKNDGSLVVTEVDQQIINEKVEQVLARVNAMELTSVVTDAEVDSLLKQAQQDILRERIFKTDASVDAMALLTEVEDELDQSFRDQIFNSLKTGFIKVRTAVADRNN